MKQEGYKRNKKVTSLRTQLECGKMRTRITPKKNTFYAVQGKTFH